jgi:hypothetical protein
LINGVVSMSDGGFNVDEHIKKRKGVIKLHSPIFNKRGRYYISFPDIDDGGGAEYVKRDDSDVQESTKSKIDLKSSEKVSKNVPTSKQESSQPKMRLSISLGETKRIGNLELTKTNSCFEVKFIKFDRNLLDCFKNLVPRRRWQPDTKKWKVPYESEQQLLDFFRKYFYNEL